MSVFGKIEGQVYGDYVHLDPSFNTALVELTLANQARASLDRLDTVDRNIVIFRGRDFQGDYMGWRTGTKDKVSGIEVVAEHSL